MKGIQIIGEKGQGKSTVALKIAELLKKQGINSVYIKHCHHEINISEKDEKFLKYFSKAIITDNEKIVSYKLNENNKDIFLQEDFIVLEGFKEKKIFPRILCSKKEKEGEKTINNFEYKININDERWQEKIHEILNDLKEAAIKDVEQKEIHVLQGERELELKPFIKKILKDILISFFQNLKLEETNWITIYLKIK